MEITGKTPQGCENQNHWNTDKLRPGECFDGWIAGAPLCVQCHDAKTTKVCLKRYTGFDSPCPGCASRLPLVDIIYQPLYRGILLSHCVVPFRESQKTAIIPLTLHQCVTVTRPTAANCGRFIVPRPKQMLFPGGREHQMPRCVATWLPVLWKYDDRITGEHLLRGPVFSEAILCKEVGDKQQQEAEALEKIERIAEEQRRSRLRGKDNAETLANVGRDLFKVVPDVNSNGKH